MSRPDYPGTDSADGPFQANTRVVAVVALAVAGAFVLLGLVLSIARAMQQRTLDRMRAQAAQLTHTQALQVMAATGGVMRSSSSKIPHLVVGPDGFELSIAHKERIKAAMQPNKTSTGSTTMGTEGQARLQEPALLSMTASTAGLLANMHHSMLSPSTSHAASSLQQPFGSSDWQISSSPLYVDSAHQHSSFPGTTMDMSATAMSASAVQSAATTGAQDYSQRHPEDAVTRPLFTASVATEQPS